MIKLEVHTFRYGNPDWLTVCAPTLDAWCARHGLPLRVWSEWDPAYPSPKFVVLDMLREFLAGHSDHALYVDADVFVHPEAPMIETAPGLCWRTDQPAGRRSWLPWLDQHFTRAAEEGWIYRNAGVWLIDRESAAAMLAMASAGPLLGGMMEQHHWNWWAMAVWRAGGVIHELPHEWNRMEDDLPGWFFHLGGNSRSGGRVKLARIMENCLLPALPAQLPPLLATPAAGSRAIVYPWRADRAVWQELRLSLRSVWENFSDRDCPIYILSAEPPRSVLETAANGRVRHLPCADYADALFTGVQLAETVLWMNDDICLLQPCGWDDFTHPLTRGIVPLARVACHAGEHNSWRRNHAKVIRRLYADGAAEAHDFSTHTPYLFRRDHALATLRRFGLYHKLAMETAYFNTLPGVVPAPVAAHKTCDPAHPHARFLNYSDRIINHRFKQSIMQRFPNPIPGEVPLPSPLALFDFAPYDFTMDRPDMSMDAIHIQMLHALACHPDIRTAVEIGCYHGASTSALIAAVNLGQLDHLHLVEIKPTDQLRRVMATCAFPEKVTLHERPYWETGIGHTDMVFMDGDHRWPVFAEALRAMSLGVPVLALHDSKARKHYRNCWGAGMVSEYLEAMPGRQSWEDAAQREGMATHRGFFVSAPESFDLAAFTARFRQEIHTADSCGVSA